MEEKEPLHIKLMKYFAAVLAIIVILSLILLIQLRMGK